MAARIATEQGRELLARGEPADGAVAAALAAVGRARTWGDDYRVTAAEAGARTLAALAAVAAHRDARQLVAEAREAIARTVALTHEETPALAELARALDGVARAR